MRFSLVRAVTIAVAVLVVALLGACGAAPESTQISTTPESTQISATPDSAGVSTRPQPTHVTAEASPTAAPTVPLYAQVIAGGDFSCGLQTDGGVVCWGSNEYGQLNAPEDERFTSIAAGAAHACGLKSNGAAVCWGHEIDLGENVPQLILDMNSPPFPPEDERFELISANEIATCGLRPDGSASCWPVGWKWGGGLSDPFDAEAVTDIYAGGQRICGLSSDGGVICGPAGDLGSPDGERFDSLSLGRVHLCGLRPDGTVLCWGNDIAGQLTPPEDGPFSAVAAGSTHTCGLRTDGSALCWGNDFERLREVTSSPSLVAGSRQDPIQDALEAELAELMSQPEVLLDEDERFVSIEVGRAHTCGLRKDGGISCWGYNHLGQATPPGA